MMNTMSSVGSAKGKNCLFADYSGLPSAPVSPWKRPGSNLDCMFAYYSVLPSAPAISRRPSESNPYEDDFVSDQMLSGSTFQSLDDTAPKFPWRPQGSYSFKDDSERELIESLYVRNSNPRSVPCELRPPSDKISAQLLKNGEKRHKLICATEGFYLGEWKSDDYYSVRFGEPCGCSKESNRACAAAKFALSSYNRTKGKKLELKELVRVNVQRFRSIIFFLTMKASDELFYEAKVLWECDTNDMKLYFVRVACHHPVSPKLQCLVGPNAG